MGLQPILPVTGVTMAARSGQAADGVVKIAEHDPRVYRSLMRLVKYSAYGDLAFFAATIALAVSVDVGRTAPDSILARKILPPEVLEVVAERERAAAAAAANGAGQPSGWQPHPVGEA